MQAGMPSTDAGGEPAWSSPQPEPNGSSRKDGQDSQLKDIEEVISVLVTGFAPFRDDYPQNPSWLIASKLPTSIPLHSFRGAKTLLDHKTRINLVVYPEPLRVAYRSIDELIPSIYTAASKPFDFVLHIGMAAGRKGYSVETRARGIGYELFDVNGEVPIDGEHAMRRQAEANHEKLEEVLKTAADVDQICDLARRETGVADLEPSSDPGLFCCEYIYYASLAALKLLQSSASTSSPTTTPLFLHVPGDTNETAIERGVAVAMALIRAFAAERKTRQGA